MIVVQWLWHSVCTCVCTCVFVCLCVCECVLLALSHVVGMNFNHRLISHSQLSMFHRLPCPPYHRATHPQRLFWISSRKQRLTWHWRSSCSLDGLCYSLHLGEHHGHSLGARLGASLGDKDGLLLRDSGLDV